VTRMYILSWLKINARDGNLIHFSGANKLFRCQSQAVSTIRMY
jgi:hypothetical protein